MFLWRSIFWLAAAYFVIGPNVNISDSVNELSSRALKGTQRIIVEQVNNVNCTSAECAGTKAFMSAGLNSLASAAPAKRAQNERRDQHPVTTKRSANIIAPIPHPRPIRAG